MPKKKKIQIQIDWTIDEQQSGILPLTYFPDESWQSLSKKDKKIAIYQWLDDSHVSKEWLCFSLKVGPSEHGIFTQSLWKQGLEKLKKRKEPLKKADAVPEESQIDRIISATIKKTVQVKGAEEEAEGVEDPDLPGKLEAWKTRYASLNDANERPITVEEIHDGVNQGKIGMSIAGVGLALAVFAVLSPTLSSDLSLTHPTVIALLALSAMIVVIGAVFYGSGAVSSRKAKRSFKEYNHAVFSCKKVQVEIDELVVRPVTQA